MPTPTVTPTSTRTATATRTPQDNHPRLTVHGERRLRVANAVPGAEGISRFRVTNTGGDSGQFTVGVTSVRGNENGHLEPEREDGDTSPEQGELTDFLQIRLSVVSPNGRVYLVGGVNRYVPASSLEPASRRGTVLSPGESAAVVLEWRLSTDVGDVIQSDQITVDLWMTLTEL